MLFKAFLKIREILRSMDEKATLKWLAMNPDISVGKRTYGLRSDTIHAIRAKVTIGKYCSIAPGVRILAGVDHDYRLPSTYPIKTLMVNRGKVNEDAYKKGDVIIGNDVWIGERAIILSGVTVGDGAVIGAGAVVTSPVSPYAIAAGVPARVIKYRFPEKTIARLLKIRWWDWPEKKILDNVYLFYSDIEAFLSSAEKLE